MLLLRSMGFAHIEDASVVNDSLAIGLSLVNKRNEEAD
jgi:hypothetical protein